MRSLSYVSETSTKLWMIVKLVRLVLDVLDVAVLVLLCLVCVDFKRDVAARRLTWSRIKP